MMWTRGFGCALLCVALAAGCEPFDATLPIHVPEIDESGLPPAVVDLPAVPALELLDQPARYADETWSVSGLYLQRDFLRGQDLQVTAIVRSIYRCDADAAEVEGDLAEFAGVQSDAAVDPEEAAEVVRPSRWRAGCRLPHMLVVDHLRSEFQLLVVGYDADHYEPQLRPGARYVFEGRFAQQAPGFLSTEDGLLVVRAVHGDGVEPPSVAIEEDTAADR
jgi:hypothetical protein